MCVVIVVSPLTVTVELRLQLDRVFDGQRGRLVVVLQWRDFLADHAVVDQRSIVRDARSTKIAFPVNNVYGPCNGDDTRVLHRKVRRHGDNLRLIEG